MFEITRTICSKSERSEQYLKQNAFRTIRIQNGKNNWDLETYRKSQTNYYLAHGIPATNSDFEYPRKDLISVDSTFSMTTLVENS